MTRAPTTEETKTTAVTTQAPANALPAFLQTKAKEHANALPAFLQTKAKEHAKAGTSQLADDNIIPLVYILQTNSPQVNRRGPDYIDGAKDGDLWLRNSGVAPIDGDHGMLFQPCAFQKEWVIWSPRKTGEGIKGRFKDLPAEAVEKEVPDDDDPTKTRKKWVMPSGDEAIETRYHIGNVYIEALVEGTKDEYILTGQIMPFVIPFKSTGHTSSKQWMGLMNNKIVDGEIAPSWVALYRVKTKSRTNPSGTWNAITVEDHSFIQTDAEFERGLNLFTQIASGEKVMEQDEAPIAAAAPKGDNKTGEM